MPIGINAISNSSSNNRSVEDIIPNDSCAAKIEQLKTMREALFSQDGWGVQHVNQDTNWNIRGTPELEIRVDPTAVAPPTREFNINNGTELWEAKLRNGNLIPPQPWSYIPATNICGTWGVDDERDTANVWTCPPPTQQWTPPQQPHWNPPQANNWAAWGDTRKCDPQLEHQAPPIDPRQDIRGGGISGRLNSDMWGQHRPPAPTKPAPVNQRNVPHSNLSPSAVRCAVPGYVEAAAWAARDRAPPRWEEAPLGLPKPTPPGWQDKAPKWAGPLPPTQGPPPPAAYKAATAGGEFPQSQPSTQQLRSLVGQIQMAVSAGYLNHQILNQPLASQTLVLLNKLLQQIRILQQLVSQHALAASQANSQLVLRCSVQISKTKQQIAKLQSDIAAQQASYVEATDPPSSLQTSFSELALRDKVHGAEHSNVSQSHVTQWKLPTSDPDSAFPRSPGPAKTTLQLNPLEATWSLGARWSEAGASAKESVYDLVAEFEPGKPWKGNPFKLAEKAPAVAAEGKAGERTLSPVSWSCTAPDKSTSAPPSTLAEPTWSDDKWKGSLAFASTWLLLKNLTAQIGEPTLKTLCRQHGPLQSFRLYLDQGVALARYSTREQASKALSALNNCVLSNTTLFAESPADSDVQMILQHLGTHLTSTLRDT